METHFVIGVLALMFWACAPVKHSGKASASIKEIQHDSVEYEVVL